MTREEAIEIINRENDPNDKKVWELFPEYREALDMAIKALSQEPCNDVISREDAIEAVKQAIYNHDSAIMRLTELPSVTQKPIECDDAISRSDMLDAIGHGTTYTSEELQKVIQNLPSVNPKPYTDAISRDVLEQIRAEIKDAYDDNRACEQDDVAYGLKVALDIIKEHTKGDN